MSRARSFFEALDGSWGRSGSAKIPLRIIGCTALMLQVDYERGTKDSDVLKTLELTTDIADRLVELAGRGTAFHAGHRMFLELVPNGLPFLALGPDWRVIDALDGLRHFDIKALGIVDVVVSKLKRLHVDDLADIEAMVDLGLVPHDRLLQRFRAAVDFASTASPDELPRCVANLHRVERDLFGVDETEIELPSWISG